jgi:hypothetical protein
VSPRSSPSDVVHLVADLESDDAIRRAAAVARLRVIGERAVPRLAAFIESDAPAHSRALAISALQDMRLARARAIVVSALRDPEVETVVAALGVLRGWVADEDGTQILEAVTAIAVDPERDPRIRAAAVEALSDLPEDLVRPLRGRAPRTEDAWSSLDDPIETRLWIETHGATAPVATLHALIERLRQQERDASAVAHRIEWTRARGLAHRALARRGSRLALFDLRESFDSAREPLPDDFVMAAETIGDASCLEPLARAWAAVPHDPTWRARLSTTAAAIAKRARLTARGAAMKRIREQWPGFI